VSALARETITTPSRRREAKGSEPSITAHPLAKLGEPVGDDQESLGFRSTTGWGDPQARFEERNQKLEQARERRETINRKRIQEAA
jgi:hypothetical protein